VGDPVELGSRQPRCVPIDNASTDEIDARRRKRNGKRATREGILADLFDEAIDILTDQDYGEPRTSRGDVVDRPESR
jgi:hypothetical protein